MNEKPFNFDDKPEFASVEEAYKESNFLAQIPVYNSSFDPERNSQYGKRHVHKGRVVSTN